MTDVNQLLLYPKHLMETRDTTQRIYLPVYNITDLIEKIHIAAAALRWYHIDMNSCLWFVEKAQFEPYWFFALVVEYDISIRR